MTNNIDQNIDAKKQQAKTWFRELRDQLCQSFEAMEAEFLTHHDHADNIARNPSSCFERQHWQRPDEVVGADGGGGEISILRGNLFEKAAINISVVEGVFSEKFRSEIAGATDSEGKFWAAGISLITHPRNPFIPPVHMNTRMIVTSKCWFGGGADLNPIFIDDDDTQKFHQAFKQCCDAHHPDYYTKFSQQADDYFTIKHRDIKRGVGGIFYDYLDENWHKDFTFTQHVGQTFAQIYPALVRAHWGDKYDESHRQTQLIKRGHYTEFNLVYDRGTRFGLMTGGNVNAVLASLPPLAAW